MNRSPAEKTASDSQVRRDIYYWKCDRPMAFHGTDQRRPRGENEPETREQVAELLRRRFDGASLDARGGGAQGNHLVFRARVDGRDCIVRIEDGPERDDYMEVEAHVMGLAKKQGVPGWNFLGVDASRREFPFAWQVIEWVPGQDLNGLLSDGTLDLPEAARKIGALAARWQNVPVSGFGPFQPQVLRERGALEGFHGRYEDYFHTRLRAHASYLGEAKFLGADEASQILRAIDAHADLLALTTDEGPVLTHKDLALWNVVGEPPSHIGAVIDWDDCVGGDPVDDISLLGCFYDGHIVTRAVDGYAAMKALPERFLARFWLHLLRNMLWKSVIRVGAGYFEVKDTANFFLTRADGQNAAKFRDFTRARIQKALHGLSHNEPLSFL